MKILIIGATGFLGSELANYFFKENQIFKADINASNKNELLDVTNKHEIGYFFDKINPEVVIDTVALSSSVECEKNPGLCKKLNFETAKNIADACRKISAKMVFISSSYVFDGRKGDYSEKDTPNPLSEYAKNKLLAEKEVLKLKDSIVLRVDLMYGLYNGGLRAGTKDIGKKEIEIGYPSQLRSPVFIEDVPKGIEDLILKKQKGIFHMAGPNKIRMLDFFEDLIKISSHKPSLKIIDSSNFIVKSPENSTLNVSKINKLGIKTTSFKDSLLKIKREFKR